MGATINLHEALRRLDALGDAVRASVRDEAATVAERMATELRDAYPEVTGNLRRGVRVEHGRRGSYVLSRAPHAHLYEWGTRERKTYTRASGPMQGAKGRVEGRNVFVPTAITSRNTYLDRLTRLIDDVEL